MPPADPIRTIYSPSTSLNFSYVMTKKINFLMCILCFWPKQVCLGFVLSVSNDLHCRNLASRQTVEMDGSHTDLYPLVSR